MDLDLLSVEHLNHTEHTESYWLPCIQFVLKVETGFVVLCLFTSMFKCKAKAIVSNLPDQDHACHYSKDCSLLSIPIVFNLKYSTSSS